jgi:hypothetical protein
VLFLTPAVNLPPVSTTPLIHFAGRNMRNLRIKIEMAILELSGPEGK